MSFFVDRAICMLYTLKWSWNQLEIKIILKKYDFCAKTVDIKRKVWFFTQKLGKNSDKGYFKIFNDNLTTDFTRKCYRLQLGKASKVEKVFPILKKMPLYFLKGGGEIFLTPSGDKGLTYLS